MNQNISEPLKAQKALRDAAVMTEKIDSPSEKKEHQAMIGEAFIEAELYEDALPTLLSAQNEHNPKSRFLLANTYVKLKKWEAAIEQFERAGREFLMENNLDMAGLCYAGEGKCYLKCKRYDRALSAYKTALTTYEEITYTSYRKGKRYIYSPHSTKSVC